MLHSRTGAESNAECLVKRACRKADGTAHLRRGRKEQIIRKYKKDGDELFNNNNNEKIILGIDLQKSAAQINADLKKLQSRLAQVKATGALNTNPTVQKINAQISALQSQLKSIRINAQIDTGNIGKNAQNTGKDISRKITDGFQSAGKQINQEVQNLNNRIDLSSLKSVPSEVQSSESSESLRQTEKSMSRLEKLSKLWKDQMSQAASSFSRWLSAGSAATALISRLKDAVSDLKEVDKLLSQISRTNTQLSQSDLKEIGKSSFDIAGKYGKNAADYLSVVREASLSGYQNAAEIAKLSLALQSAGGLSAEQIGRAHV